MGQQQLFLIVLVMILIGIATIIAIEVYEDVQNQSNREAVVIEMMGAVPNAQAYYKKPGPLGGGNSSFQDVSIRDIVLQDSTENGTYEISDRGSNSFLLVGNPLYSEVTVRLRIYGNSIQWVEE